MLGGYFFEMEMWELGIKLLDQIVKLSQQDADSERGIAFGIWEYVSILKESDCGVYFLKIKYWL